MFTDPFGLCPEDRRDAKGNCPGGLSVSEWDAVKATLPKMMPGAGEKLDNLLEGGKIHGGKLGLIVMAQVRADAPGEVTVNRDPGDGVSAFKAKDLGWYLLHESAHVAQLKGKAPGAEAGQFMRENKPRLEAEADDYADANCKTTRCK